MKSFQKNVKKRLLILFYFLSKGKGRTRSYKKNLRDKDFIESIMRGDEDFKEGRFKEWSEVREYV